MTNNMEYKYINLEYLYEVADDDTDFVKEIIDDYLNKMPGQFAELENAVGKDDQESTKFIAHKMKSSFHFVGAQILVELAQQIENAETDTHLEVYARNIGLMKPVLEQVLVELKHKRSTI
jgi:HPt (histidine-containing phosphotransfer) domain-containing protein